MFKVWLSHSIRSKPGVLLSQPSEPKKSLVKTGKVMGPLLNAAQKVKVGVIAIVLAAWLGISAAQRVETPLSFTSICSAPDVRTEDKESRFLAENEKAMTAMMAGMSIKPSGDIDKDFVGMMAAHHQGAIDMAQALLRYGRNEQLRRIAHEIIVTQQAEISAMRMAAGLTPLRVAYP